MEKNKLADSPQPPKWKQHLALALPSAYEDGCVWVHACSVGEINSIAPLIRWLLEQKQNVHLTVVTQTGMQRAQQLFHDQIYISFLPWDLPGRMAKLIDHIRPRLLLLTETEFWPGMLNACRRRDIPVIGINTRISDRSFPRYRATRFLWKRWLRPVKLFLAQSGIDAERLEALGIERERIRPVGNLKYAITPPQTDAGQLRSILDPSNQRPILVIASTHHDEEQRILKMWPAWKQARADLMLLIVPRHPERFDEVARTLESGGRTFSRWSALPDSPEDIILVDAMGILQQLYTVADIAVIGGTLVPVGGHNPLEAAVCGRGVITGPHIQNFREMMHDMQKENAAIVTNNETEMEKAVIDLLRHPDELRQLHAHAAHFIGERGGVLGRVCDSILPWLLQVGSQVDKQ